MLIHFGSCNSKIEYCLCHDEVTADVGGNISTAHCLPLSGNMAMFHHLYSYGLV